MTPTDAPKVPDRGTALRFVETAVLWGDPTEVRAMLAEALFCSSLQPSARPGGRQVQAAVTEAVWRHHVDPAACASDVAQCYGDEPETACTRMRWCLSTIAEAYEFLQAS